MDTINAIMALIAAGLAWYDVWILGRDKCIHGVYWPARAFYAVWNIFFLVYYLHLNQPLSFVAGLFLTSGNVVWTVMAGRWAYTWSKMPKGLYPRGYTAKEINDSAKKNGILILGPIEPTKLRGVARQSVVIDDL